MKSDHKQIHLAANILRSKILKFISDEKKTEVATILENFKDEFPLKNPAESPWSEERRAEARERFAEKRKSVVIWIRDKEGKVTQHQGIEAAAKVLRVKDKSLYCYLSVGGGFAEVKGFKVSRTPLNDVDPYLVWEEEYFDKHGIWPNPAENPHQPGKY